MNKSPSTTENLPALLTEVEKTKRLFTFNNQEEEKDFYKKNSYLFATTSASLFRLRPQIPYSEHKSIFEKLLFNLQLLNIEEKYVESFIQNFEVNDKENSLDKAQEGQPMLFCGFHTGAYSILPALLINKGLDFGFLSNQTLVERKKSYFLESHSAYCKKHGINSTAQVINVEESKGIWKAIRMLKEGKSLIVYADGNTGSNDSKKENTVKINFIGEDLLVRKGIAFLSYACKVPIVPIISTRADDGSTFSLKRKFDILSPIYPPSFIKENGKNKEVAKEEFAAETMQKLYSILEKEITEKNAEEYEKDAEKVSQWEGWIFVNKFFEQLQKPISSKKESVEKDKNQTLKDKKNNLYIFNEERFALIESKKDDKKITLFDKFTYRFFPVSDLLYEVITYFSVPKKLYLSDSTDNLIAQTPKNSSDSPVSTDSDFSADYADFKLQLSKTLIPVSAIEKLIEKEIVVQYK